MSAPLIESAEKFERYNPVNPLPEEIRALPNDETVCKFCGVSYLIHNEIKKLELELEKVNLQLEGYQQMKTNFSGLEKENNDLKDKIGTLQQQCTEKEQIVEDLSNSLSVRSGECSALKEEYSNLNDLWEQQKLLHKEQAAKLSEFQKYACIYPSLLKQLSIVKEQRDELKQEIANYKRVFDADIKIVASYMSVLSSKYQESDTRLQENLLQTTSLKDKVKELTKTNTEQSEQLVKQRDKLSVLERSSTSLNHAQQQNVQLSQIVSDTQREVEALKDSLMVTAEEKENLQRSFSVKSQENSELKQMINDLTKRHTSQIENLNKKYHSSLEMQASLKTKIDSHVQNMVKDKENIASKTARLEAENGELVQELSRLTQDLQSIEERTRHVSESHKIQLSELHVSYQEQLKSALAKSNSYQHEIDKLEAKQSKRNAELKNSLKQAQDMHESQLKVLENTYKKSQIELEKQIDSLSSQYSRDLRSKEQAIKDIEKTFSLQFDSLKSEKCSLQNCVNQLNQQISEYEKTIKQLECKPPPPTDESDKLKSVKLKNSELETEVLVLQRTVQKECEERLELTEKLDQLKAQLTDSVRKGREISDVPSRNSVSSISSQNLLNARPKIGTGLNHNKKNSKKKAPKNYSSWLQK